MVSKSCSIVGVVLAVAAALAAPPSAHAQLSTVPKRYRSQKNRVESQFGRRRQVPESVKEAQPKRSLRGNDGERELEEQAFSFSPIQPLMFSMRSSYMEDPEGMSLPSIEAMSVAYEELPPPPTQPSGGDGYVTQELGGDDDGTNNIILASFLAGISALVVGAAALFVKMRRVHGRSAEDSSEMDDNESQNRDMNRIVSFASHDEYQDFGAQPTNRQILQDLQEHDVVNDFHDIDFQDSEGGREIILH